MEYNFFAAFISDMKTIVPDVVIVGAFDASVVDIFDAIVIVDIYFAIIVVDVVVVGFLHSGNSGFSSRIYT